MGDLINIITREEEYTNEFIESNEIPIGLKQPPEVYRQLYGGRIPREDIVTMHMGKQEQNTILLVAPPGAGKTQLLMRIAYYRHCQGCKQILFNPKGGEYLECNTPTHRYKLLPSERQTPIPIEHYLPSFAAKAGVLSHAQMARFNKFSMKLKYLSTPEEMQTLGFSPSATMGLLAAIAENGGEGVTVDSLMNAVRQGRLSPEFRLHAQSREQVMRLLTFYRNISFFEDTLPDFCLHDIWRRGGLPVISSYMLNKGPNSYVCGKILSQEFPRRSSWKKMAILDDAQIFLPSKKNETDSISIDAMMNLTSIMRLHGWDACIATQTPELINSDVLQQFSGYKIFGRVGLNESLLAGMDYGMQRVINDLHYDKEHGVKQFLLVREDNVVSSSVPFYPLGPIMGHPINLSARNSEDFV